MVSGTWQVPDKCQPFLLLKMGDEGEEGKKEERRWEGWLSGRIIDYSSFLRKFSKADEASGAEIAYRKVPHF